MTDPKRCPEKAALSRRNLLRSGAAVAATGLVASPALARRNSRRCPGYDYLFTLGVASGDPSHDSVTLWTRLAPEPTTGGGMRNERVAVKWRVATDEHMRHVVRKGVFQARPETGHTVQVRPRGLREDRWYYYQFEALGQESRIGRTRTFPGSHCQNVQKMRFALASCQDYQNGFFGAYRHMAEEDLDFVLHVGDYIYEYGPNPDGPRQVPDDEITTLEDYRNRYALYRLDTALQDAHAAFPFIVTFDDHEVDNNYAGLIPEDDQSADDFLARRTAAYQAFYENIPMAPSAQPRGANIRVYRDFAYGSLANISLLDTRQYRSDQPCGDGFTVICEELYDPSATLLGDTQQQWLEQNLSTSSAQWNVIAQQIMVTQWDLGPAQGLPVPAFNMDAWDGYPAAREKLMAFLDEAAIRNPVVLTGDIHSSWLADLKRDYTDESAPVIATEFVGTSIASDFPLYLVPVVEATLPANPHIKFFDGVYRGYIKHEVTAKAWTADYMAVDNLVDPNSSVSVLASFAVEDGKPGAENA